MVDGFVEMPAAALEAQISCNLRAVPRFVLDEPYNFGLGVRQCLGMCLVMRSVMLPVLPGASEGERAVLQGRRFVPRRSKNEVAANHSRPSLLGSGF